MNISLQLSPHFNRAEWFVTSDRAQLIAEFALLPSPEQAEITDNMRHLAERLEPVRVRNGRPMPISSGYRTWRLHQEIYRRLGQRPPLQSAHLDGSAADFPLTCLAPGMTRWLHESWDGGFGRYSWGCHLDTGKRRRW